LRATNVFKKKPASNYEAGHKSLTTLFDNQLALFVNKVSQIAIHLAEIVGYNKAIN